MEIKLRNNIYYSFLEKIGIILSQFISSILISRFLPREEFGSIAVVSGAFAFLQFVNISVENVLVKDFKKLQTDIDHHIIQFIQLNFLKTIFLSLCSISIGGIYYYQTGKIYFIYAAMSLMMVMSMDMLISPLIIYASLLFKQKLVTKISLVRWGVNVVGLCFLYIYPCIQVVLLKDSIIFLIIIFLWRYQAKSELNLNLKLMKFNWKFLTENTLGYSIWVHLIGVISNIVYKADAFILYYFVSLQVVGNYNIALTVANVANIIPSILINQNNVAVSHCHTDEEAKLMTGNFLRYSIYIGFISLLGFVLLGKLYLRLVTAYEIEEIYQYLLFIVSGLLVVKMIISPLVSYINMRGEVKRLFFRVQLPLLLIVLFNYTLFSYLFGAKGAAISNFVNGILWLVLIYIEITAYGFKISHIGSFKNDYNQVKSYVKTYLSSN